MAVTRRQKEIIDFLESFVSRNGYSPSFEEIARGMNLKSLATVHKHITNLEKKGLLDRVHNRSRSIDVLPPGARNRTSDRLPLAGRIAAGLPVETSGEIPETISLHDVVWQIVMSLRWRFAGTSMRDEHIINSDYYVLVERTRTARQGEIVVALVHGSETTLKRFYAEGQVVRLQRPANVDDGRRSMFRPRRWRSKAACLGFYANIVEMPKLASNRERPGEFAEALSASNSCERGNLCQQALDIFLRITSCGTYPTT